MHGSTAACGRESANVMSGHILKSTLLAVLGKAAEAQSRTAPVPAARKWRPGRRAAILLPGIVIGFILLCAAAPGWVAPYAPSNMDENAILAAPSLQHLLGTDQFGGDIASAIVYGARQSVLVAFGAILLGASGGSLIGMVAGYRGGAIDAVAMRLIDIWLSIPPMLLALIVAAALGGGFGSTVIAIASMLVPRFARVIRARVLGIKALPFIASARAMGASRSWILQRHVLPHTGSIILVLATLGVADSILIGASLSFIGLGVNPDQPDWGYILSEGRNYLTDAWWYATFPGLAITLLTVSVNLLGDALQRRNGINAERN
jgi:peptide/nickel transport system permease protein